MKKIDVLLTIEQAESINSIDKQSSLLTIYFHFMFYSTVHDPSFTSTVLVPGLPGFYSLPRSHIQECLQTFSMISAVTCLLLYSLWMSLNVGKDGFHWSSRIAMLGRFYMDSMERTVPRQALKQLSDRGEVRELVSPSRDRTSTEPMTNDMITSTLHAPLYNC